MKILIFPALTAPILISIVLAFVYVFGQNFEFIRYLILYLALTSTIPFIISHLLNILTFHLVKNRRFRTAFVGSL